MLDSVAIFDFQDEFWETQKWKRQTLFFKNSGQRFLIDTTIRNTNNIEDRLTIKKNQRHKFLNFWEPSALKSYCQTHRIESDIICFLEDAGNVFGFNTCSEEAKTCKLLSELKKIKGTNFLYFRWDRHFLAYVHDFIFSIWNLFSCIQNKPLLLRYGPSKQIPEDSIWKPSARKIFDWVKKQEIMPSFFWNYEKILYSNTAWLQKSNQKLLPTFFRKNPVSVLSLSVTW